MIMPPSTALRIHASLVLFFLMYGYCDDVNLTVALSVAGEGSWSRDRAEVANSSLSMLNIDIPLDGIGLVGMPAAEAISPVFTLWITLVVMYLGE